LSIFRSGGVVPAPFILLGGRRVEGGNFAIARAAIPGLDPWTMGDVPAPKRRRGRLKLALFVVLGLVVAVVAVPLRFLLFPPTFDVVPIQASREYQDPSLIARAWELPVARTFRASFDFQSNPSTCGPTSVADVVQSWGMAASEQSVIEGSGRCQWFGICFGGLSLDELASVGRAKSDRQVSVLRDFDFATFRKLLPRFNDPTVRFVANFQRGMLMGKGTGHFSPIGGYLEHEDLVFVLDTNQKFRPWLVSPKRLFEAIDSLDGAKKRGLLLFEVATAPGPSPSAQAL
jgi:hypothetical protein